MRKIIKKIVTIGGGTGSAVVLLGLKSHPVKLSAIVTMTDSGGSTGKLIRRLKVHPMGDIRQILTTLSETDPSYKDFFNYRFEKGELKGHSTGNLFLAAFEKIYGNLEKAIQKARQFLKVRTEIIPVTLERTDLVAYLTNGRKLVKEDSLDLLYQKKLKLKKLGLTKKVRANPQAIKAIKTSDIIVICPGNPCRSVLPNFLVDGINSALEKTKAKVILVANLFNKIGQTDKMNLSQVISFYERYIGKGIIDFVVYNTSYPGAANLKKYRLKDESILIIDKDNLLKASYKTVGAPLLAKTVFKQDRADVLLKRTAIRHDAKKLGRMIMKVARVIKG